MTFTDLKKQLVDEVISDSLKGMLILAGGKFIYVNRDVYRILGYPISDMKGKGLSEILELIHPDDRDRIHTILRKFEKGGRIYSPVKFNFRRKDNSYIKIKGIAESLKYSGEPVLKIVLNDSSNKLLAQDLKDYHLKNFFKNTNQGIAFLEFSENINIKEPVQEIIKKIYEHGYFSYCNEIFASMFGFRENALEEKSIQVLYGNDVIEYYIYIYQKFIENNFKLKDFETLYRTKYGNNVNFLLNFDGVTENGILKGIWISQTDITSRKKTEKFKDVIYRITEFTNSVKSIDELFSILHEIVWSLMPAHNFYIALYDQKRQMLSFPYYKDVFEDICGEVKFGNGLTEYVIRTGRPLLATPDTFRFLVEKGEVELIGEDSIDWLGVPLKIRNKSIGAIVVQSYDPEIRYTEDNLEILTFISEYAAIAIERKTNEELLIKNESRYRSFIEQSLEGIYYVGYPQPIDITLPVREQAEIMYKTGVILDCNNILAKMYGFNTKLDLLGQKICNLYAKDEVNKNIESIENFAKSGYAGRNFETIEVNEKGEQLIFINNLVGTVEDGFLIGNWGRQIDITEQKKAEKSNNTINAILKAATAAEEILLVEQSYTKGIKNALLKIGKVLNTEEVGICENIYDIDTKKHLIKENISVRINSDPEVNSFYSEDSSEFPIRWFEKLYKGHILSLVKDKLPNGEEKNILIKWGCKNVLLIPIVTNGVLWGFVKFININLNRLWETTEISVLRSFANAIGGAINKEISDASSKENESRMRGVLSALPDIMIVLNEYYVVVDYYANNPEIEFIPPVNLLNKNITEALDNSMIQNLIPALENARKSGKINIISWDIKNRDKMLYLEARVVFCEDNKFIIIIRDISHDYLKKLEIERLYKAVEQSPAMVMITNRDSIVEYVNDKYIETTGYSKEEIIGKNAYNLRDLDETEETFQFMKRTLQNGDGWHGEYKNRKKNGEFFWVYESISPIKNEKNEVISFIAIKEDVTERRRMVQDLITAKEKAEESVILRNNFLANMSHELRTPLHGILGFSQLLFEILEDNESKMMAETINTSATRLLDTLNLILNLSKAESGPIEINAKVISVNDIINDVVKIIKPQAQEKRLYLKTYYMFETISAELDERLFREITIYLLKNAIKYTERGGVIVETSIKNGNLILKVTDTGIGIPRDKFDVIFEEFRQESEGYSRSFEGTGLGLTLAKKYTELMNGTISVDSEVGKGSLFTVQLPLNPVKESVYTEAIKEVTANDKIKRTAKKMKKVLMVENDMINASLVKLYLRNQYQLSVAGNIDDALEIISKEKFDVILMDINLGDSTDGIAGTKMIKSLKGWKNVPVVAVTAFTMKGDRERFLEEGCDYYIAKPFDKEKLISLLESIFKKTGNGHSD